MPAKWIEVWGYEPGDHVRALLFKIPASQWDEAVKQEYLLEMERAGIEGIDIREVEE